MNKHKAIPTKEELTNAQLGPVLAVLRELQPFLLEDVVEVGDTPKDRSIDGGVSSAAATTFIKACARIDGILDDESRYSLTTYSDAMSEFVKTHKIQQKFIAEQILSTQMLRKPHFALRPTLVISGDGYIAFWGEISDSGEAICGFGGTPNEALADFDNAFNRAPKEQVIVIAEKAGIDLNPPKNPPTQ